MFQSMLRTRFLVICLSIVFFTNVNGKCVRPSVLILSFDGFRHDYVSEKTPNLYKLRSRGTYTDHMNNVFPTKTFPNHHSLATGVYPEVHGVLANKMFDPKLNRMLEYKEIWNYNKDVVPLWTLNEKSADDCHSGVMMWPGSELTYQDTKPKFFTIWSKGMPWKDRVDSFIGWFKNPITPANLVMAYFEEPDNKAHHYGSASPQVLEQIKNIDNLVKYIDEQLISHNLTKTNVFLLSDHGMVSVKKATIITVGDKIKDRFNGVPISPLFSIWPKNMNDTKEVDAIYNILKNESRENQHFSVFRKSEIPDRWHYKNNNRASPILVLANDGYGFQDLLTWRLDNYTVDNMTWGVHGYDNNQSNMWPFFMSWGPLIKVGHKSPPFKTVDLYSLWSEMLQLTPPKTNGTLEIVRDLLVRSNEDPISAMGAAGIAFVVIVIIGGGLIIAFFVRRADKNKQRRHDSSDFDPARARPEGNPLLDKTPAEQASQVV